MEKSREEKVSRGTWEKQRRESFTWNMGKVKNRKFHVEHGKSREEKVSRGTWEK